MLLHSKGTNQQNEKAVYRVVKKSLANHLSDKRLVSKIHKELMQLNRLFIIFGIKHKKIKLNYMLRKAYMSQTL